MNNASDNQPGTPSLSFDSSTAERRRFPRTNSPSKIAIVDDEPVNVKIVRKHLQIAGYSSFITTTDSKEAIALLTREQPDVVLLDVMMPDVDGIQILQAIRANPKMQLTPVLILTASTDSETKLKALNAGATDFLAKPVDPSDLLPRIRNSLIVKAHHDHLANYSEQLEREVQLRTFELEISRKQVIHCLARAAENRDDNTGRHVLRVGRYASILARELGFDDEAATVLGLAAQLHDVGKIGLPDAVLLKKGKLTEEEYDIVKRHCDIGHAIVQPVPADDEAVSPISPDSAATQAPQPSRHLLLEMAARIAWTHHERWDGTGYPRGLKGNDIPIEGRITSVADVFDALSSSRPYKPAYPPTQCFTMMAEGRGTQFDPAVLDALMRRADDIIRIQQEQADALPAAAASSKAA
jgi:putative two-component system response regulator